MRIALALRLLENGAGPRLAPRSVPLFSASPRDTGPPRRIALPHVLRELEVGAVVHCCVNVAGPVRYTGSSTVVS